MSFKYKILETFNTSIGLIAMVKFTPAKFPGIGTEINYKKQNYKIAGTTVFYQPIDMTAPDKVEEMRKQGIWDCLLQPV